MTDPQYQLHLKALGKITRLWDDSGIDTTALKLLVSRLYDQVATGEVDSYDGTLALNQFSIGLNNALSIGENKIRTTAKAMAEAYLKIALAKDLTTLPSSSDAKNILEALQTEMGAGLDNKTLSNSSTTGFVNFFDSLWSPSGSWNTALDASADYKDSIYVVTAIV